MVQLINHGAVTLQDLPSLLMRYSPHVIHFSGHSSATGIELIGNNGLGSEVPPGTLAEIVRILKDDVSLVVLNTCNSATQAEEIVKEIDCAIGMNDTIRDDAAVAFSAAFYEALGYGRSIQVAFDLAIVQMTGVGADKSLAKLYKRPSVKPEEITLVAPPDPR